LVDLDALIPDDAGIEITTTVFLSVIRCDFGVLVGLNHGYFDHVDIARA
jgi:hypothetical protein